MNQQNTGLLAIAAIEVPPPQRIWWGSLEPALRSSRAPELVQTDAEVLQKGAIANPSPLMMQPWPGLHVLPFPHCMLVVALRFFRL